MNKPVVLVTGANGEIGRSLLERLHADGRYRVVTVDLTPLPERYRGLALETYAGNIMDRYLLDQVAAHHEIEVVFHLAALLSTRGERDPDLAHQVNVEGTLHLLRMAQNQSGRLGRPVRFIFPSSIAVYGLPSLEEKAKAGRVPEDAWNVPITMYGCNKLYCEHLGRYFTKYFHQLGALASAARMDFRSIRFPGLISAETAPTGGTSDFGPAMLHAAAQRQPYTSFVGPEAKIPFMAMPDAVSSLVRLLEADRSKLTRSVYNVSGFSVSAKEIADRVKQAFPSAETTFEPDAVRSKIVDSWPEDIDDSLARTDWAWKPAYDFRRAFEEYLIPTIRKRYGWTSDLSELRIPDVLTFLAVCRHGSVTGAARDLRVTPSQVSKAVARLEKYLKRPLLSRKARGVTASEEGQKIVPRLEELVEKVQALSEVSDVPPEMKLTLAAPSYLCAAFLPNVVAAVPDTRFRGLECGNAFMRAYATENIFQVAITIGEEKLPDSWVSSRAGVMRRGLFASPEAARRIGPNPTEFRITQMPFILPVYNSGSSGQFLPSDDGCPIPREARIMGHEAATAAVGFELAAATNQLVFGPVIGARTLVLAGRLVEVKVPGWRLVDALYFHANADRVLSRVQKAIIEALQRAARDA